MIYVLVDNSPKKVCWDLGDADRLCKTLRRKRISFRVIDSIFEASAGKDSVAVVYNSPNINMQECVDYCNDNGIPIIVLGCTAELSGNYCSIGADTKYIARSLNAFFEEYGLKKVLCLSANADDDYDNDLVFNLNKYCKTIDLDVEWVETSHSKCIEGAMEKVLAYDVVVVPAAFPAIYLLQKLETVKGEIPLVVSCGGRANFTSVFKKTLACYTTNEDLPELVIDVCATLTKHRGIGKLKIAGHGEWETGSSANNLPFPKIKHNTVQNEILPCRINDDEDLAIVEISAIEKLLYLSDDIDRLILKCIIEGQSFIEMENTTFCSKGSIRYRINNYKKLLNCESVFEIRDLLSKYIDSKKLF